MQPEVGICGVEGVDDGVDEHFGGLGLCLLLKPSLSHKGLVGFTLSTEGLGSDVGGH